jgi:hypothetical protein
MCESVPYFLTTYGQKKEGDKRSLVEVLLKFLFFLLEVIDDLLEFTRRNGQQGRRKISKYFFSF